MDPHDRRFVSQGHLADSGALTRILNLIVQEGADYEVLSFKLGNMLPSWIKAVCVDIAPPVITKLADRGSAQTVGIVTDAGLFLRGLAAFLIGSS